MSCIVWGLGNCFKDFNAGPVLLVFLTGRRTIFLKHSCDFKCNSFSYLGRLALCTCWFTSIRSSVPRSFLFPRLRVSSCYCLWSHLEQASLKPGLGIGLSGMCFIWGFEPQIPLLSWHSNGKVIVTDFPSLKNILRIPNSIITHLFLWESGSVVCPQG